MTIPRFDLRVTPYNTRAPVIWYGFLLVV